MPDALEAKVLEGSLGDRSSWPPAHVDKSEGSHNRDLIEFAYIYISSFNIISISVLLTFILFYAYMHPASSVRFLHISFNEGNEFSGYGGGRNSKVRKTKTINRVNRGIESGRQEGHEFSLSFLFI